MNYFNKISDEQKPYIIFNQFEKNTYESILEYNGLLDWPKSKLIFDSIFFNEIPHSIFPKLYFTKQSKIVASIELNEKFDPSWLNILGLNYEVKEISLDSNIRLSNLVSFDLNQTTTAIHNPHLKTIYYINQQRLISYKLDLTLVSKILKNTISDTALLRQTILGIELLEKNKMNNSSFGSFTLYGDTLITVVNLYKLTIGKKQGRITNQQYLCAFKNGKLIWSNELLGNLKSHTTYDEAGDRNIHYQSRDSIYIVSHTYKGKNDVLINKNCLALFTLESNAYKLNKYIDMRIPEIPYKASLGNTDNTLGSFIDYPKSPRYYYCLYPEFYNLDQKEQININDMMLNGDTAQINCSMYNWGLKVSLILFNKTKEQYICFTDKNGTSLKVKLTDNNCFNARFYDNRLIFLSPENRKIQSYIFKQVDTSQE